MLPLYKYLLDTIFWQSSKFYRIVVSNPMRTKRIFLAADLFLYFYWRDLVLSASGEDFKKTGWLCKYQWCLFWINGWKAISHESAITFSIFSVYRTIWIPTYLPQKVVFLEKKYYKGDRLDFSIFPFKWR